MGATVNVDDQEVLDAFNRLLAAGRDQTRVLNAMGRYGKTSTQLRFRTQTGPDGKRWKPSKRVEEHGGQTLRLTGRLRNSIMFQLMPGGVEWGTNVVYAAAHQFGIDKQQSVRASFRSGRSAMKTQAGVRISYKVKAHKRHMKLPARPFLGINGIDKQRLIKILNDDLEQAKRG